MFKSRARFLSVIFFVLSLALAGRVFASATVGSIDSTNRRAWSENLGWIDFGTTEGGVSVKDAELAGYAWSENAGWISLNCSNTDSCSTVDYKVANNDEGALSGKAWSENLGWIDFAPTNGGVKIDASGDFSGYAWGENAGWIVFSCNTTSSCDVVNYKVSTDWRPKTVRAASEPPQTSMSGGGFMMAAVSAPVSVVEKVVSVPVRVVRNIARDAARTVVSVLPDILKPEEKPPVVEDIRDVVKEEPPRALSGEWSVFPFVSTNKFVLAPLPREIATLANKIPEFGSVLAKVGVKKITDLDKLREADVRLPSIKDSGTIPSEIVFAHSALSKSEIPSSIQVSVAGKVEQKIHTVVNRPITLSVRVTSPAESVRGYLAFKKGPQRSVFEMSSRSFAASALLSAAALTHKQTEPIKSDTAFVLFSFDYADPDKDGVYTASISAPQTEGEYEVITVITYKDENLGTRETRLLTVVDPEGYVFEKIAGLEARVPRVKVNIFEKSGESFTLWNAKDYNQDNPQTTDGTGKYAFLVPPGEYYITAEAKGYAPYRSDTFDVSEGNGVHFNIELTRKNSWLRSMLDWRTLAVIVLAGALFLNFRNDRRLMKILINKNKNN